MPTRIEAYTADGVATGIVARAGKAREILDGEPEVLIEGAQWLPLDGSPAQSEDILKLLVDDILLVVAEEIDGAPMHAQWHTIELDSGPYHVHGELPTLPGFDPGRALARPSGEFILLRDVTIGLVDRAEAGQAMSAQLLVNRYGVDRIEADLMLGFFFPGATMTLTAAGETGLVGLPAAAPAPVAPGAGATPQPAEAPASA